MSKCLNDDWRVRKVAKILLNYGIQCSLKLVHTEKLVGQVFVFLRKYSRALEKTLTRTPVLWRLYL